MSETPPLSEEQQSQVISLLKAQIDEAIIRLESQPQREILPLFTPVVIGMATTASYKVGDFSDDQIDWVVGEYAQELVDYVRSKFPES